MRSARAAVFAVLLVAVAADHAWANPLDAFGTGARGAALGNAMVASAEASTSAFTNPAAGCLARESRLLLGYSYGKLLLRLDGEDPNLLDPHGTLIALETPLTFGPVRAGLGATLYFPDQFIARLQLLPATEPRFVMLDGRIHRIVVNVAASARMGPYLAVGAGATFLADAAGNGVFFRVGVAGGRTQADAALDVELPTRAAPIFGILFLPDEPLRFGLRWSGPVAHDIRLDVASFSQVPGTAINGDLVLSVRGIDNYTPAQLAGGFALDLGPRTTFLTELAYTRWSDARLVASDVQLLLRIGTEPSLVQALFAGPAFHDTLGIRVGVEHRRALRHERALALRAGYAFAPTPVPDQTGITSFADNDRHVFSAGVGLTLRDLLGAPWSASLALQYHHLVPRATRKDQYPAPGGDFTSDGHILRAELTLGFSW